MPERASITAAGERSDLAQESVKGIVGIGHVII